MRKGLLFAGAFFLLTLFAGGIVVLLSAQERETAPLSASHGQQADGAHSRPSESPEQAGPLLEQVLRAPGGVLYGISKAKGFVVSFDGGRSWIERNQGLPRRVVYPFTEDRVRRITSLAVDPRSDGRVAVTTADSLYLSEDYGDSWAQIPIGKPLRSTSYLTAVALSPDNADTLVVGTSFNGFFETRDRGATWKDPSLSARFLYRGAGFYEEISGLAYDPLRPGVLYFACGFGHGIYAGDENRKSWTRLTFPGDEREEIIRRLEVRDEGEWVLRVTTDRGLWHYRLEDGSWRRVEAADGSLGSATLASAGTAAVDGFGSPAGAPGTAGGAGVLPGTAPVAPGSPADPFRAERLRRAAGKYGIYVSSYRARGADLENHLRFLVDNGLNSLVVDCKDDFGWVTYDTQTELPRKIGAVNRRFSLDELIGAAHARGIYVIGRVVVFKDRQLYNYNNYQYAAWNFRTNQPWRNLIRVEEPAPVENVGSGTAENGDEPAGSASSDAGEAGVGSGERAAGAGDGGYGGGLPEVPEKPAPVVRYVQNEFWLDPYSPFVWEYNLQIAEELQRRGIDEVQFDYIRFPSDGNLSQIRYRHQREGMSRIDALESFLSMARERISIPISSDLYGFNSWHRMGNWIGQNIDTLADYVDVISPMFYPSHFPRDFIKEQPYLTRAYTIYQEGTTRAASIVGGRSLIRPYVQAFLIGGELAMGPSEYWTYLVRQVEGTLAAPSSGFTLWNASNRYYMVTGSLAPLLEPVKNAADRR